MLLVEAGKRVAGLEARKVGACSTGNSTGNLYPTVDVNLQAIAADLYRVGSIDQGKRADGFDRESTKAPQPDPLRMDAAARGQLDAVKPGENRQLELQGQPVAVSRPPEGALHVVQVQCIHMGCTLKWNGAETSWDCECHGSGASAEPSSTLPETRTREALIYSGAQESDTNNVAGKASTGAIPGYRED